MKIRGRRNRQSVGISVIVALVAVGLIVLFLVLLQWIMPFTQLPPRFPSLWNLNPEQGAVLAGAQLQARAIVIQMIGGIFLAGTLAFTVWTLRVAQQELQVAQEGQITERFTRATDQLGSENLMTRLGGIYALERIARDSERDHWPIMEILTANIRESAPIVQTNEETREQRPISPDVQASLTVIGRRDPKRIPMEMDHLNLSRTSLGGADLRGAHLERVNLREAHLEGVNLRGAHLEGANFTRAHLEGADLIDAHLEDANLLEANLEGAYLGGANLKKADLIKAHMKGTHLIDTHLENANLLEATGLTQEQIDHSYMDVWTFLSKAVDPEGRPLQHSTRVPENNPRSSLSKLDVPAPSWRRWRRTT